MSLREKNAAPMAVEKKPNCECHGCPLPGGISPSIGSSNNWFCRYHFNEPAEAWPAITKRLRENQWLIELLKKINAASSVFTCDAIMAKIARSIESSGCEILTPKADELLGSWMLRAHGYLGTEPRTRAMK